MEIVRALGIPMVERRISLAEFHSADEVFTTGTMGELTPVYEIDGRRIGYEEQEDAHINTDSVVSTVTRRIQEEYRKLTLSVGCKIDTA